MPVHVPLDVPVNVPHDQGAGPIIASATIGPGHDGRAEVVVELLYPNGARTRLSVGQEAITRAVDAAGVTSLAELTGRPWTALVHGLELI